MTRLEKIFLAVLLLLIIGTAVFWKDVESLFTNKRESVVDDEFKNEKKHKKDDDDKKKDKKKKKDNKDEARHMFFPQSYVYTMA